MLNNIINFNLCIKFTINYIQQRLKLTLYDSKQNSALQLRRDSQNVIGTFKILVVFELSFACLTRTLTISQHIASVSCAVTSLGPNTTKELFVPASCRLNRFNYPTINKMVILH